MWLWVQKNGRVYAVKAGYRQLMEDKNAKVERVDWAASTWNRWVPLKICVFMWKFFHDRLPTLPNLKRRKLVHQDITATCKLCDESVDESLGHLFFNCCFAKIIWKCLGDWLRMKWSFTDSVQRNNDLFYAGVASKYREI